MLKLNWMRMTALGLTCALALSLNGCETYGEAAGLGAAVGAVGGAVIGHQSGHALEGAAIGAALGGATGAVAHKIKSNRQREAAETAAAYNYQPAQGEMLRFEGAQVMPKNARPGDMIEGRVQYALLGSGGGVQVQESRLLLRNGQVIAELSSETLTRTDGTWSSSQNFRLPNNQGPGLYTLETRVRTAKSSISGQDSSVVD